MNPAMPERISKTLTAPVVWANMEFFWLDPNDFLSRLVTMGETWLYHYDGILLIDYLPKGQTINAEYYSYLLVQLKNIWRRNAARRSPKGLVLARQCPGSPGTCNPEETGLPGLPFSLSPTLFSGSGPVELPPVPWTQKTIERSPFSVRRKGHCCRGDLVGRTILWIFLSGLRKLEQRSKKSIELGEYVE